MAMCALRHRTSPYLSSHTQSSGTAGQSKESVLDELAADILSRVPLPFDLEAARYKYPVDYHESMNTVLTQELVRFNWLIEVSWSVLHLPPPLTFLPPLFFVPLPSLFSCLLAPLSPPFPSDPLLAPPQIIHSSLGDLRKAIKGLVVMSGDLEAVGNAMYDGKVPKSWMQLSYPSIKPLASYVTDLCDRLAMFRDWIDHGAPVVFWMSGFFFTHAFLTGVKQNFARKGRIPIDTIAWNFKCLPKDVPTEVPADGAYVKGLFLEGARWDYEAEQLAESDPKVLFSAAPMMWLQPAVLEELGEYPHYECPLYVTTERKGVLQTTGHSSNFVMDVKLPTDENPHHWIRRGVALMLSLAD